MASILTGGGNPFTDLREICCQKNPNDRLKAVKLRMVHPLAQDSFKELAKSNNDFMAKSHFMRQIKDFIEKVEQKHLFIHAVQSSDKLVTRFIEQCSSKLSTSTPYTDIENVILNSPESLIEFCKKEGSLERDFPILLGYFRIGVINETEFLDALEALCRFYENNPSFLIDLIDLSVLKKLSETHPQIVVHFFSFKNSSGHPRLADVKFFTLVVPILKKLATSVPDQVIKMLSINEDDTSPLLNPAIFEKALPIFIKLSQVVPEQLENLLSSKDQYGNSLLHHTKNFEIAIPMLTQFSKSIPKVIVSLFNILNRLGNPLLHYANNFEKAVTFLEELIDINPQLLQEILSIKNLKGSSPFHSPANFEKAIPFFEKLAQRNLAVFNEILSLKDSTGDSVLTCVLKNPRLLTIFMERNVEAFIPALVAAALKGHNETITYLLDEYSYREEVKTLFNPTKIRAFVHAQKDFLLEQEITLPFGVKTDDHILTSDLTQPVVFALSDAHNLILSTSQELFKAQNIDTDFHNAFMKVSCLCLAVAAEAMPDIFLALSKYMTPVQQACSVPFLSAQDFFTLMNQPELLGNSKLIISMASPEQMHALLDFYLTKTTNAKNQLCPNDKENYDPSLTSTKILANLVSTRNERIKILSWVQNFITINEERSNQLDPIDLKEIRARKEEIMKAYDELLSRLQFLESQLPVPIEDEEMIDPFTKTAIENLNLIYGEGANNLLWVDQTTCESMLENHTPHPRTRQALVVIKNPFTKEPIGMRCEEAIPMPSIYKEYTRRQSLLADKR